MLALDDFLKAADRVGLLHILPLGAGEGLGHAERLGEELLDLARAGHRELVVLRQLVHAQDRDDVLEVLVPLEDGLDPARDVVVLLAHDLWVEDA